MKINKKYSSILMSSVIVGSMIIPNFSSMALEKSDVKDGISIEKVNDNELNVNTESTSESVSVLEVKNIRTVTITNKNTGKIDRLVFNYKEHTFYSSYTNKLIKYKDNSELVASIYTDRSDRSYSTVRLTYSQIRNRIGAGATAGGIVGLVVGLVPGAEPIGGLIGEVSTIIGALSYTIPNDSRHGLIFKIRTTKYYRNRGSGRHLYRTDKAIVGVRKF